MKKSILVTFIQQTRMEQLLSIVWLLLAIVFARQSTQQSVQAVRGSSSSAVSVQGGTCTNLIPVEPPTLETVLQNGNVSTDGIFGVTQVNVNTLNVDKIDVENGDGTNTTNFYLTKTNNGLLWLPYSGAGQTLEQVLINGNEANDSIVNINRLQAASITSPSGLTIAEGTSAVQVNIGDILVAPRLIEVAVNPQDNKFQVSAGVVVPRNIFQGPVAFDPTILSNPVTGSKFATISGTTL